MLCPEQCVELTLSCTELTSNEACWLVGWLTRLQKRAFMECPDWTFSVHILRASISWLWQESRYSSAGTQQYAQQENCKQFGSRILTVFLINGRRGFLVGCIAWAVYKCNIGIAAQQAAAGAAAGSSSAQQGTGQGVASAVSTLFSTPPAGRHEYKSGQSAGPAPGGNASSSQSGWSAPGRGHKLGS